MPTEQEYPIGDLASLAGVTPRTVRYYVSIGLLPSPGQQGPGTRYGAGHLARLRLIRKLQREHLPLGEIGTRLARLDDDAVEEALEVEGSPAAPGSALEYIRQLRAGSSPARMEIRSHVAAKAAPMAVAEAAPTAAPMAVASAAPRAAPPPAELARAQRSQWERVALSQNVELHIRRPLGRIDQKRVERLIRIGREILEEDQP